MHDATMGIGNLLVTVVVLLIETDAQSCYQCHVDTGRDCHCIRLLTEEDVFATQQLTVDARNNGV